MAIEECLNTPLALATTLCSYNMLSLVAGGGVRPRSRRETTTFYGLNIRARSS